MKSQRSKNGGRHMKKLPLPGRASRPCAEDSSLFPKLTARAQVAMTLAHEEALRRGDDYIGTEHLLLGLLREEEGIAARVLREGGVDLDQARAAVDQLVGQCANPPAGKRALRVMPRLKQVL